MLNTFNINLVVPYVFQAMVIVAVVVRHETDTRGLLLPVLSLVVSAVPVALPMVITVTLAVGASKSQIETCVGLQTIKLRHTTSCGWGAAAGQQQLE